MLELNTTEVKLGEELEFTLRPERTVALPNPSPWDIYRKSAWGIEQITHFGTTQNVVYASKSSPRTWIWKAETKGDEIIELDEERRVFEYPEVTPGNYLLKLRTMEGVIEEAFDVI